MKHTKRNFSNLLQPSDYYLLLIFQVDSNEVATKHPKAIKRDFGALGGLVKGSGAQAVLFSTLPDAGNDEVRNRKRQKIINWDGGGWG